jgi:hypothetical protein
VKWNQDEEIVEVVKASKVNLDQVGLSRLSGEINKRSEEE